MSKRYSIDSPGLDSDSDLEEDIVLGSFNPTSRDRDLLLADEAVLNDLNKKNKTKRSFFSSRTGNKYTSLASDRSAKKKVGFSGTKPVSSQPTGKTGSHKARRSGYAQLNNGAYNNNSDDSDSDFPSDIEIDIKAQPRKLRQGTKRLHSLLLFFLCVLGAWFFYTHIFPVGSSRKSPLKRTLLSNGTHDYRPTTVVISLDGFHPHYINDKITPNLHELITQNSGAPYMTPSFPSSTFPNHWTMVTGLFPGNHGIVGNTFFDEKLNRQFFNTKPAQSLDPVFWGGQPIWQTASFQGVMSAVHMWPGSEVEWATEAPVLVDKFNQTEVLNVKTNRVISWLDRDVTERPELILAYVPTVDSVGHAHGIKGKELIQALSDVDSFVGTLMKEFDSRNLSDILNLVVVSDHGMSPTSNDRLIYLDELVEMSNIEHVDGWPLIGLRPKPSLNLKSLYANLKDAHSQFGSGKWDVYLREDLPKEWNFGGTGYNKYKSRIAPIWLIPRVGWSFTTKKQMKKLNGDYKPRGVHGYNNTEVLMRALFVAKGPYFSNDLYEPFANVGLYNLVCDTLGLQPAANNGPPASSVLKMLPTNWTDGQNYPGLPFDTEILDINSTYETLFGSGESTVHEEVIANIKSPASSDVGYPTSTDVGSATAPTPSTAKTNGTVTDYDEGDTQSGGEGKSSSWQEWMKYVKSKASSVKSWVVDKYNSITEHKDPNEKDSESTESTKSTHSKRSSP